MKIFRISTILLASGISQAHARINLISTIKEPAHPSYVQIISTDGRSHLIKSSLKTSSSTDAPSLYIREMRCGPEKYKEITKSPVSHYILPSISMTAKQNPALIHIDHAGKLSILQLNNNLSMALRTTPLNDMNFVRSIATNKKGYFIGGTKGKDMPSLHQFSHDLKKSQSIEIMGSRRGEISTLFENRGRMLSIVNYHIERAVKHQFDSELKAYGPEVDLLVEIPLNGNAATGIALKDGGFAISYWIGEHLYMEKRSENFGFRWRIKLHQRQSAASIFGKMVEVGNEVAWVGTNDRKLLVHRINQQDRSVHTSIDTESGVVATGNDFNYVHAYGNELHIVSADSRRKTDSGTDSRADRTEFCFIESPDF